MGLFIENTNKETKLVWVRRVGTLCDAVPSWSKQRELGRLPCLWVHNGGFDALGVAYDAREFERMRWAFLTATRPMQWYTVPMQNIKVAVGPEKWGAYYVKASALPSA